MLLSHAPAIYVDINTKYQKLQKIQTPTTTAAFILFFSLTCNKIMGNENQTKLKMG